MQVQIPSVSLVFLDQTGWAALVVLSGSGISGNDYHALLLMTRNGIEPLTGRKAL